MAYAMSSPPSRFARRFSLSNEFFIDRGQGEEKADSETGAAATAATTDTELLAEVRKYVSLAVGSFRRLQDESAEHFVRHVYDLVRSNLSVGPAFSHTEDETASIFEEVLRVMRFNVEAPLEGYNETAHDDLLRGYVTLQRRCVTMVNFVYGSDSVVLSDIYLRTCRYKIDSLLYEQAVEYASHCVALRVAALGPRHAKTAQAQYYLGVAYIHTGEADEARRALEFSRGARVALNGESEASCDVADCDLQLGVAARAEGRALQAYSLFYRCFRTRCALLGAGHPQTLIAAGFVVSNRHPQGGRRLISKEELLDGIVGVRWPEEEDAAARTVTTVTTSATASTFAAAYVEAITSARGSQAIQPLTLKEILNVDVAAKLIGNFVVLEMEAMRELVARAVSRHRAQYAGAVYAPLPQRTSNGVIVSGDVNSPHKSAAINSGPRYTYDTDGVIRLILLASCLDLGLASPSRSGRARESSPSREPASPGPSPSLPLVYTSGDALAETPPRQGFLSRAVASTSAAVAATTAADDNAQAVKGSPKPSPDVATAVRRTSSSSRSRKSKSRVSFLPTAAEATPPTPSDRAAQHSAEKKDRTAVSARRVSSHSSKAAVAQPAPISAVPEAQTPPSADVSAAAVYAHAPTPPPLPTSWPPVPYEGSSSSAAPLGPVQGSAAAAAAPPVISRYKRLNYEPLSAGGLDNKSLWKMRFDTYASIDEIFPDLENEFAAQKKLFQAVAKEGSRVASVGRKADTNASPVSAARVQNISIMLAKFGKTPVADIALYVRDMDTDKLGLSALHALERFLPTSQEAKELGAYMEATNTTAGVLLAAVGLKSKKSSSRAEEYLFEMSKVPHVAERIRIMSLCESIDDSLLQLEADYDSMVRGVAEVKGSSRLLYILRTTVELVNALKMADGDSNLIEGIKLDSLLKLFQSKTNSGMALDLYIVSRLAESIPDVLEMEHDMPSLDDARKVSLERMREEVFRIEKGLETMASFDVVAESATVQKFMLLHLEEITTKFRQAKVYYSNAASDFEGLCRYFGESGPMSSSSGSAGGGQGSAAADPNTLFTLVQAVVSRVIANTAVVKRK